MRPRLVRDTAERCGKINSWYDDIRSLNFIDNRVSFSFISSLIMYCYVRRGIITQNCQVDIKCMKRGKCELVNVNETVLDIYLKSKNKRTQRCLADMFVVQLYEKRGFRVPSLKNERES